MTVPSLWIGHPFSDEPIDYRWSRAPLARLSVGMDGREVLRIPKHQNGELEYLGDNHLLTIAGTGAGKGRSVIIPNLIHYAGPVVVFDPKGENYAVTARRRKELGQEVWKIDPFNLTNSKSDQLNPFDIFLLEREVVEAGAGLLSDLLPNVAAVSAFDHHHQLALDLISGLIAHVAADLPLHERSFNSVWELLSPSSAVSRLTVLCDDRTINTMANAKISAFLDLPAEELRPVVLNTARRLLESMQVESVRNALGKSSFDIKHVVEGKPLSIFIIIPPDKLKRHSSLLRLWLGVLIKAVLSRSSPPASRSLFLLDECGKFGAFQILEDAITLGRGYGMQVWTFWQDMSQIKALYPAAWRTILANCDVYQFFGPRNQMISDDFAEVFGVDAEGVRRLRVSDQVTVIGGGTALRSTRLDCLYDTDFKEHCDVNPIYGPFKPREADELSNPTELRGNNRLSIGSPTPPLASES